MGVLATESRRGINEGGECGRLGGGRGTPGRVSRL